jgi:hypothetical protein
MIAEVDHRLTLRSAGAPVLTPSTFAFRSMRLISGSELIASSLLEPDYIPKSGPRGIGTKRWSVSRVPMKTASEPTLLTIWPLHGVDGK